MKNSATLLYPNDIVGQRVSSYSESHSTPLPAHITAYHDLVGRTRQDSFFMISDLQAQFQLSLARIQGARRILEIGVYVGYSSLVWSHAVGPQGSVTGLEFEQKYADLANKAFADNGVKNVDIKVGDALKTLPDLNPSEPYDIIFIDAQKSGYPEYLETILSQSRPGSSSGRILRPGGLIIADNVLRRSLVADDSDENPHAKDSKARAEKEGRVEAAQLDLVKIREYNDLVVKSDRLEAFLLPLFDGVSIARLLD
ncbi:O-methyltransferase [Geosmithia morbida]|uniref:O-methyltransferase n=1 Tax=Geosmithia morbida TaxID=1094350 RepID=A0A9P5D0U2_9HYPO|nr:O-methyltransferase [Geosmithia morbida]KAF4119791.1 O-methyltransferase [Geosmithia morbida]